MFGSTKRQTSERWHSHTGFLSVSSGSTVRHCRAEPAHGVSQSNISYLPAGHSSPSHTTPRPGCQSQNQLPCGGQPHTTHGTRKTQNLSPCSNFFCTYQNLKTFLSWVSEASSEPRKSRCMDKGHRSTSTCSGGRKQITQYVSIFMPT